jgi:hypothetical protein
MSSYFTNFPTTQYDILFDGYKSEVVDIFRIVKVKKQYRDDVSYYTYYDIQDGERPDIVSARLYGTADYYWTFFMINDNLVNVFTDWPLSTEDVQHLSLRKYAGTVLTSNEDFSYKFTVGTTIQGLQSGATATILDKDPDLGIIKIQPLTKTFVPGEVIRDTLSNEFITITGQALFKDAVHHFEDADGYHVPKNTVGATPISNEEHEFIMNDNKSKIKVLRPEYVQVIADQFIDQIKADN